MSKSRYCVIAAVILGLGLVYWLKPAPIPFTNYSPAVFVQQLTPLLLVAIFIERSLEVVVTVWQGDRLALLEQRVNQAAALPETDPTRTASLAAANDALQLCKCSTKQKALPLALILGVVISSLGVRGLGNFADLEKVVDHTTQKYLFNLADVLLTGALMGGGSDFVHKIITTLTEIMDATSQRSKGAGA